MNINTGEVLDIYMTSGLLIEWVVLVESDDRFIEVYDTNLNHLIINRADIAVVKIRQDIKTLERILTDLNLVKTRDKQLREDLDNELSTLSEMWITCGLVVDNLRITSK
jgi:DNA integrity scanning protein DisA with diadenylate cyclase activity